MPIRPDFRALYPVDWPAISNRIRFERAAGLCEKCRRPHGAIVLAVPDGRWCDPDAGGLWRSPSGDVAEAPAGAALLRVTLTRVVLTTAHLRHDPRLSDDADLAAWCQRCHLAHDRPYHWLQRRITVRSRLALGDLFDGPYEVQRFAVP